MVAPTRSVRVVGSINAPSVAITSLLRQTPSSTKATHHLRYGFTHYGCSATPNRAYPQRKESMNIINVTNEYYTDPLVMTEKEPARPCLLSPNLKERFVHWLGFHFSFGQPYCVVCGKKKIPPFVDKGVGSQGARRGDA